MKPRISACPAIAAMLAALLCASPALAWGERAHAVIDRAAVASLPKDGPLFLQERVEDIAASASMPDSWRSQSEPFSKMAEDPNHGWFKEQFAFMKPIPRSRYEFVLALYRENLRIRAADPAAALRTNVRWTGTLPYAAMESYGRLVAGMRIVRAARAAGRDAGVAERNCAYEVAVMGHYIGDGSQPLHTSIHSDGWRGPNPAEYTRDRSIHGRYESKFVDAIALTQQDVTPRIAPVGHADGDLFDAVLAFLDGAGSQMETIYRLDKRGAFEGAADKEARELVYGQAANGAGMLRDMIYRAWLESAQPGVKTGPDPLDTANPAYNAETGSAPALHQ